MDMHAWHKYRDTDFRDFQIRELQKRQAVVAHDVHA